MIDLRTRLRAELLRTEFGASLGYVAERCGVSKSSVRNWCSAAAKPRPPPRRRGPPGVHTSIAPVVQSALRRQPLTSALELCQLVASELGTGVSRTTMYKTLRLLGMSFKLATRCRLHQAVARNHPFFATDPYDGRAMMLDESGFYFHDQPSRGWSAKGRRVPKAKVAPRRRLSLLLVTDRTGVVASRVLSGGVKGEHIAQFVATLPSGRPLILDNASVHRTHAVKALCAERCISLRYMPPYSPWYNPVENAFAQAKHEYKRRRLARSGDMEAEIMASVATIKNFDGMFAASRAMWTQDRVRTDQALPLHSV